MVQKDTKTKTVKGRVLGENEAGETLLELAEEIAPDDELDLSDFEGEAEISVWVYRRTAKSKPAFLFKCTPVDFSLDTLRDNYGGGEFTVYVKRGRDLIKRHSPVVEPPPKPAPSTLPPNPPDIAQALQQAVRDVLQQIRPQETEETILARLKSYKEILGGASSAAAAPADMLAMFRQGIEFAKEFAGNAGEKGAFDVLERAIATFGAPLATIIQSQLEKSAMTKNPPLPGSVKTATPQQPALPSAGVQLLLKAKIKELLPAAARDSDPALYADLLVDQFPIEQLKQAMGLGVAAICDMCIAIDPRVSNYRPWFDEMLQHIADALAEIEIEKENVSASGTGHEGPATGQDGAT